MRASVYICPHCQSRVDIRHATAVAGTFESARKRELLRLLAAGESGKEMAAHLGISHHTVKNHLWELYRDMGARNARHAVALALQQGLIEPPQRTGGQQEAE